MAGVDRPIGHAVSRLLAQTVVGSKLAPTEELEGDAANGGAAGAGAAGAAATGAADGGEAPTGKGPEGSATAPKDTYRVVGTLCPLMPATAEAHATSPDPPSTLSRNAMELAAIGHVQLPGDFVETGVRKRDAAKREAIERFSVPGRKAAWVSDIVAVSFRGCAMAWRGFRGW